MVSFLPPSDKSKEMVSDDPLDQLFGEDESLDEAFGSDAQTKTTSRMDEDEKSDQEDADALEKSRISRQIFGDDEESEEEEVIKKTKAVKFNKLGKKEITLDRVENLEDVGLKVPFDFNADCSFILALSCETSRIYRL